MSTTGIELKTPNRALAEAVELVSSMRFAISMLAIIAIASVIGTVLKQNEPMSNYVNQFGPFWFDVFGKLGLYAVYSTWWFLLLMGALVLSTSLCIVRNTPKMLKDMRSWREQVREQSLQNFHHKTEWQAPLARAALAEQTAARLRDAGYGAKVVEKDGATLVAAKKGAGNKFGYIFAHSAIVIVCVGGFLDSDMPIRFQQAFMGKVPFTGNGVIAEIPAQHRLGLGNPSFRGNMMIPEGSASSTAIIPRPSGVLVQDLPFSITLKKFVIDFYSTAVYQSSFEDGGTKLKLTGFPMAGGGAEKFALEGEVGGSTPLKNGVGQAYTVEWSGFRPFNVENLSSGQDVRAVNQEQSFNEQFAVGLDKRLGSAAKNANNKDLKNVGPSVQYKLRDQTGQAREYQNYMQPLHVDGADVYLAGMRANPADQFSYLRIPADDEHSVRDWMRLRAALQQPALRAEAARRYAARAMPAASSAAGLQDQLRESANKSLDIFAGDGQGQGGFLAVSRFLEKVAPAEQEKAAQIFLKILNGCLWDLWQLAREQDKLSPVASDEAHGRFLQLAVNALSDSAFYGAPVYLQLDEFVEIKASVLQVTRAPGQNIVYLGCLLLVLGVFSMFYIRERRLWVWIRDADGGAHALMAMSTQRKTLDFEHEFAALKKTLPLAA